MPHFFPGPAPQISLFLLITKLQGISHSASVSTASGRPYSPGNGILGRGRGLLLQWRRWFWRHDRRTYFGLVGGTLPHPHPTIEHALVLSAQRELLHLLPVAIPGSR